MPTLNVRKVSDWLRQRLSAVSAEIDSLHLFGSVTRGKPNPGDCDVLILTQAEPDSPGRKTLRSELLVAEAAFLSEFCVPLSVLLLGVEEYQSLQWFKENGREQTLIRVDIA